MNPGNFERRNIKRDRCKGNIILGACGNEFYPIERKRVNHRVANPVQFVDYDDI